MIGLVCCINLKCIIEHGGYLCLFSMKSLDPIMDYYNQEFLCL